MNKSILKCACCISLLFCAFEAMAQKDYVITNQGDTIRCKISIPLFEGFGSIKYRPVNSKDFIDIEPNEIKEYRRGDKEIMSAVKTGMDEEPRFMNLLERGRISIYYYKVKTYINTGNTNMGMNTGTYHTAIYWYCGKQNVDTVMALKTSELFMSRSKKSRKEDFGEMLKDNPNVYNKYIADDKFSFGQLRKLIHLYNTGEELEDNKYRGY